MDTAAGYSLMELIVVLAIFSLIAGLAGATLRPRTNEILMAETAKLSAALMAARTSAIESGAERLFVLTARERRYETLGSREAPRELPGSIALTIVSAESEVDAEGRQGIRFFPDGSSTGGRVTLRAGASERVIRIDWLTGDVDARKTR